MYLTVCNETYTWYLSGPFLAVLHAVACPFSKYLQILYIFAQIFKHFVLFQHFFCPFLPFFWKTTRMPLLFRIGPAYKSRYCFLVLFFFTQICSFFRNTCSHYAPKRVINWGSVFNLQNLSFASIEFGLMKDFSMF